MLKEVTQNRLISEAFIASRGLVMSWNLTELTLRAFVDPIKWRGSDQYRSSIGIPLLAENFYSSLSVFQQTLFAGNRPFLVEPTASTSMDVARSQEVLIGAQLKKAGPKGTSAKQELRAIGFDALLYGTGVGMVGWETRTIKKLKRRRKTQSTSIPINDQGSTVETHSGEDDLETYTEEYQVNQPVIEHVPIRRVRVAPDCRRGDIRTASWRGRLIYLDSYQLDSLRDVEGFKIPTREQLIALTTPTKLDGDNPNVLDTQGGGLGANPLAQIATTPQKAYPEYSSEANTVDPLAQKFEVFEYITDDRICWVLENQYVCRNQANDDDIVMLSFNFREAPDSFFGYGMGMWLTDFQRIAQGVTNAFFDDLALNLMGTYTSPKGLNNAAQNAWIYPGKVFKTDGAAALEPMKRNAVGNDPLAIVSQVKGWASNIVGAGAGVQGANPGAPGDMRTGAGVQLLSSGEMTKMQDLVDQVCELVYVPMLEFFVEHNRRLKPSQLRMMLTDELGQAFTGDPLDIINGAYKVSISAGAKLAARQALNSSLGYIQSVLQQPGLTDQLAVQGMKFNYAALVDAVFESTGFPYREQIVIPMTDEDKQRLAQQQGQDAAAQKLQSDLAKIAAQRDSKIAINENQSENRALLRTQEAMLEHSDKNALGML